MTPKDVVRQYLARRGSPAFVVTAGLGGLVRRWEKTSRSVRHGYPLGLEDYMNDLDGRQLLAEAFPLAKPAERKKLRSRVVDADALFKRHSKATRVCLWGAREANRRGWTSRKNWWYYRLPTAPGEILRTDLSDRRK